MREWGLIQARPVLSDRKIRIPDKVREPLMKGEESPGVHWHLEKNAKFIIISSRPVYKPTYKFVNRTSVLFEGGNQKIRPPADFDDSVLSRFDKGDELTYLMYEDFEVEETGARYAFLLDEAQMRDFLPNRVVEESDDLHQGILNAPGFLPEL
jgi:hypothetical protein